MRTCSIDGCENKHEAKGYCKNHYKRYLKYGNPLATPIKNKIAKENIKEENGKILKYCKDCLQWLTLNEDNFYKDKNNDSDGFTNYCKMCLRKRSRNYSRNPEVKKRRKLYHARWTRQNRDREAENKRRLRKENPDHYKRYIKDYQNKNMSMLINYARIRKEEDRNFKLTKNELKACREYFNYCCAYCGMTEVEHKQIHNQRLHQEHVIVGGRNNLTNCVLACKECNSQKSEYSLHTWYNINNHKYSKERYSKIYHWIRYEAKNHLEKKRKRK